MKNVLAAALASTVVLLSAVGGAQAQEPRQTLEQVEDWLNENVRDNLMSVDFIREWQCDAVERAGRGYIAQGRSVAQIEEWAASGNCEIDFG